MTWEYVALGFNLVVLIANLIVLGFSLKVYTEVVKDKNQDRRSS